MEYLILPLVGLIAALLTFFSGFGLGTLLLPVFSIYFPIPVAMIMTAIIHFFNNFFKFLLVRKKQIGTLSFILVFRHSSRLLLELLFLLV